jgi:immunity protein 5 of polymorphic toxin system
VAVSSVVDEDGTVANQTSEIVLSKQDLREVTSYAAASAQEVLEIFERAQPADSRPRDAIDAAWRFARGGERGKTLRDTAWRRTRRPETPTPRPRARRREQRCWRHPAAYLHPLADAHQVKHILGAAAHAARAAELVAGRIELSALSTLSRLVGARHQPSLTCSAATPRHRLAEGVSGSCFAIWMRPSAAVSEGLVVPGGRP